MAACPNCGRENPEDARFCNACGAELAAAEPERESRKVVTILFCDVVGSTALGETTDPEALRKRMQRYFDDLRTIVERHGGRVEKFVGDAVMAVFGIPVSHEDDALRAVRAASEMGAAIATHGLEARIGVNTGEVVVGGEGETLVTGDAVNVAARLEQTAPPGQALIGAETRTLVRDAVRVEPVEPLQLKGKAEPVDAFRLLEVLADADAVARHLEAPLVGRERERERLRRDFEDVVAERTCRLFTLLGPAGIGKSRLVADFLEHAEGEADVLRGRCLHYGEGITYWPLVEILVGLGIDPDTVMGSSPEETRLVFRRLLETRATERPQVVVLDDLHWAEPTFLDLVEHIADFSRDTPIFLVCVARTELLDLRPGWGGGKLNATSILLEPLEEDECETLIENLLQDASLDGDTRGRIAEASEGNPLFVEEMLAMVREQGDDWAIVVPSTIQALLQARLDQLGADERTVIERGSVEGKVFHRGAVAELTPLPVRPALESHLTTLVRKELIRPDRPTFPDDDAFRFRHLLIRDAAYESLPKATRAELHERFANWLARHELVERDEILGYHLEQAHRYRAELDSEDPALAGLASRSSDHLAAAGRAALGRGDYNAGRTLLRRASAVLPPRDERRFALGPDLYEAMMESGERDEARAILEDARGSVDPTVRAMVAILEALAEVIEAGGTTSDERRAEKEAARETLEEAGHDEGLSLYWWSVALEKWLRCRAAEGAAAWERALFHAERSGNASRAHYYGSWVRLANVFGPTPIPDAIQRVEALHDADPGAIIVEASARLTLGCLLALQGDVDRGRDLCRRGRETIRDAGMATTAAAHAMSEAWIEELAGDVKAEERILRSGLAELEQLGDRSYYSTAAVMLAECLRRQGRNDEVAELCASAREHSSSDDLVNFIYLDAIEGYLLAQQGLHRQAQARARDALERAETTDFWAVRGDVRFALAEMLALAGRMEDAGQVAAEGLAFYEAKGAVLGRVRARERLGAVGIPVG